MRIDLFLKVSGLLKTRSIAGRAIASGSVLLDGAPVKASARVEEGTLVSLVKPDGGKIVVRVLQVPGNANVSRKDRTSLYEVIERGEAGCC